MHQPFDLQSKSPECKQRCSESELAELDDEQLFYTASIHFLKKKLQEKFQSPELSIRSRTTHESSIQLNTTHCCKNHNAKRSHFNRSSSLTLCRKTSESDICKISDTQTSLSMQQVLPFPKSRKKGFFKRIKNTFKILQPKNLIHPKSANDSESVNISHFKFLRCHKLSK